MNKVCVIPFFVLGLIAIGQIQDSSGHGLGSETMPPVMVEDIEATLEINSSTIYVDEDGEEKGKIC